MSKEMVALFCASGTMGFEAFRELRKRRGKYDIVGADRDNLDQGKKVK